MQNQNKVSKGKDGIISIVYIGEQSYSTVDDVFRKTKKYYCEGGKLLKILVNLENVGKLNKGVLQAALKALRTDIFEKIAVVKSPVIYRALSQFVISASEKEDEIKFFDDEEEALKWLKARRQNVKEYYPVFYD